MKKYLKISKTVVLSLILALCLVSTKTAFAAQKSVTLPTTAALDDIRTSDDPSSPTLSNSGINLKSPSNDTTTQTDRF